MGAPIGSQNAKGNKGGGRKGYEYEKKQLKTMRKILNEALALIKKIQKGNAPDDEVKRFQLIERSVLKIMDKLHATKQEQDSRSEHRVILEGFDKIWK